MWIQKILAKMNGVMLGSAGLFVLLNSGLVVADPGSISTFSSPISQNLITDNAMRHVQGSLMVNMAAGVGNSQANAAVISVRGPGGHSTSQPAQTRASVPQNMRGATGGPSVTEITGNAFAQSSGLMAINQANGRANAEFNHLAIQTGLRDLSTAQLSNSQLAQSVSGPESGYTELPSGNMKMLAVGADAFKGARGVAMVTQVSGSGNAASNNFALNVQAGAIR